MLTPALKEIVSRLIEAKMQMPESEKAPRIDQLNEYIVKELHYYKETVDSMRDDRTADWEALNHVFLTTLCQND